MKQVNLLIRSMFVLFLLGGVLLLTTSFYGETNNPKPFVVAGLKQGEIDKSVVRKLTDAYKAQFGPKAQLEQIKIVREGGSAWLWFVGAVKGSPTFALQLKASDSNWTLNFIEPMGINNCITAGDCARCKIGCDCARDQGTDKCNTKTTSNVLSDQFGQFAEVLQ